MTDLVQYYLVDRTLHLRQGKACAQCAHGALYAEARVAALRSSQDEGCRQAVAYYDKWRAGAMVKIVLKAEPADLDRALAEIPGCVEVRDLGLTELRPDTRTVVTLPVLARAEIPDWIRDLRLL